MTRNDTHTAVTSGDILPEGTTITISATPDPGYDWTELRLTIFSYVYDAGVPPHLPAGWRWQPQSSSLISNGATYTIEENKEYCFRGMLDLEENIDKYDINQNITGQGSLDFPSESRAGNGIFIGYTPGNRYALESLTVTKTDNSNVSVEYDPVSNQYYFEMPESAVTINAVFSTAFYIHFDPNKDYGGAGTMKDQSIAADETVNLSTCTFTNDWGQQFAGWNTKADGTGTSYANGASVTNLAAAGETITLYAQWSYNDNSGLIPSYTVFFDANGGTGKMDVQAFLVGKAQNLRVNAFTREGYSFIGWSTTPSGNVAYTDGQSVTNLTTTVGEFVTLYAQWSDGIHYTVHFDKNNGGEGTMPDQVFTVGVAQALTSNAFTPPTSLMFFSGWNTKADGTGTSYANGATVTDLAAAGHTVTLYAQWEDYDPGERTPDNTFCSIIFDANGGTGTMPNQLYIKGETKALNANTFTRVGYNFTGWNTAANGSGTSYANQQSITLTSMMTLYAQWSLTDDLYANGDTYIISTAAGWDVFCDALQDNTTWNRFSGKTVKLGNSISVTRMAGSDGHDFCGTFDGNGKTLTVNLNSNDITDGSNQYVAPFRYVSNVNSVAATIKNLHVTGNITTGKQFTGGLIGGCWGAVSIENCSVSTAITSTISGAGGHGGIVGIHSNGTLTITGTVFDGRLLGTTTHSVGGFIGWRNGSARIYNSLFAPAAVSVSNTTGATFGRNDVDTYNCYYTTLLCDGENYVPSLVSSNMWRNGTAPFIYNAKPDGIGTESTTYNVSGITAYENGIKCGTEYYTAAPTTLALAANLDDGNYWTTFYCGDAGYKINDEENACAYTAEYDAVNAQLTLHKLGKVIPKGTVVIIVDEDNSIGMTASTAAAEYSVENNLHGMDVRTLKSTLGSGTFYVMGKVGDNFGFFEYTADYMPARKAYLLVDGGASLARGLRMVLEEEETGIRPTPGPSLNGGEWYDLSGRKLDGKPTTKGVYILKSADNFSTV